MKVILTGSTGFIGGEVLEQCVQHPSITSIVALSRRQLSESATVSPKVQVVIIEDYLSYSSSTLQAVQGAEACIWSLGKAWMPDNEAAKKVIVDYTMAAARAFTQQTAANNDNVRKFCFVYLSGGAAERDQTKPLWFMRDYRRIRGQVENELLAHVKENPNTVEAYIMRPGMVLAKDANIRDMIRSLAPSVKVDVLAKMMLKMALDGFRDRVIENPTINQQGGTM